LIREHPDNRWNKKFIDLIACHHVRVKAYDELDTFLRAVYPEDTAQEKRIKQAILAWVPAAKRDWPTAVARLQALLPGARPKEALAIRERLLHIYEGELEDNAKALAMSREIEAFLQAKPADFEQQQLLHRLRAEQRTDYRYRYRYHHGRSSGLLGTILQDEEEDEGDSDDDRWYYNNDGGPYSIFAEDDEDENRYYYWGYYAENSEAPRFQLFAASDADNDWQAREYLRVAGTPAHQLSPKHLARLRRATERRLPILRLLLKQNQAAEAESLTEALLALRPAGTEDADLDLVRAHLLNAVAGEYGAAHDEAKPETRAWGDRADALVQEARTLRRAIYERAVTDPRERAFLLRSLAEEEASAHMARARERADRAAFTAAYAQWKALQLEKRQEEIAAGRPGDLILLGMATRLVDAARDRIQAEDLAEAEALLADLEQPDSARVRVVRALIHLRRGEADQAVACFEESLAEHERKRQEGLEQSRWLGRGNEYIRYQETPDPLERMGTDDLLLRAQAYKVAGRDDMVKRLLEAALKKDPKKKSLRWKEL